MIVISNHAMELADKEQNTDEPVIRLNLAWVPTTLEAQQKLEELAKAGHEVYLDYPQGRTKPPKPTITLDEAVGLANQFDVEFFAVSNVEDPDEIGKIRTMLHAGIQLVPKIESKKGIENLELIVSRIETQYAMLDKEDLYTDVNHDTDAYNKYVEQARSTAKRIDLNLLELQGVVFA